MFRCYWRLNNTSKNKNTPLLLHEKSTGTVPRGLKIPIHELGMTSKCSFIRKTSPQKWITFIFSKQNKKEHIVHPHQKKEFRHYVLRSVVHHDENFLEYLRWKKRSRKHRNILTKRWKVNSVQNMFIQLHKTKQKVQHRKHKEQKI